MGCASSKPKVHLLFGADLVKIEKDEKHKNVPRFVVECVKLIESKENIETEGIYRISGAKEKVDELVKKMDIIQTSEKYEMLKDEEVHTLTSALKLFFRQLSIELIPTSVINDFPKEMEKPDGIAKIKEEVNKLDELPKDILKFIIKHLKAVDKHNKVNKMTAANLAIAMGPPLFPKTCCGSSDEKSSSQTNKLVQTLIEHFDAILK